MGRKSEKKTYNWDTKIASALRKIWRFSPERHAALAAARAPELPSHVVCALCNEVIDKRTAAVDHVEPVVPLAGFVSWDDFILRLKSTNLRVLCTHCHKVITNEQSKERRRHKPKKKACSNKLHTDR